MKKLLILLFIGLSLFARAQYDTLDRCDREPTFYYWGDYWIDYVYARMKPDSPNVFDHGFVNYRFYRNAEEKALCCYTKDTLRVIGVAAAVKLGCQPDTIDPETHIRHIKDTTILPEYFRLFYFKSGSDTATTWLGEARFDTMTPRYVTYTGKECHAYYDSVQERIRFYYLPGYKPIYEAYFDSAVNVIDTFYASATGNNNYIAADSVLFLLGGRYWIWDYIAYFAHPVTRVFVTRHIPNGDTLDPIIFGGKTLIRYNYEDAFSQMPFYQLHTWMTKQGEIAKRTFFHIFPIFDTASYIDSTALSWCLTPDQLRVPMPDADDSARHGLRQACGEIVR